MITLYATCELFSLKFNFSGTDETSVTEVVIFDQQGHYKASLAYRGYVMTLHQIHRLKTLIRRFFKLSDWSRMKFNFRKVYHGSALDSVSDQRNSSAVVCA